MNIIEIIISYLNDLTVKTLYFQGHPSSHNMKKSLFSYHLLDIKLDLKNFVKDYFFKDLRPVYSDT